MSLKEIFSALEREAEKQNEEMLAAARKQADELLAEANESATAILAEETEKSKEQLRAKEARIILEARFKSKRRLVETKEKLIDNVFNEARKQLQELPKTKDYPAVFTHLALEAAKAIGNNERVVVSVSQGDLALAHSIFARSKIDCTVRSATDGRGGVIISSENKRKVLTNTLESRLNRASTILRNSVAEVLFK